MHYNRTCVIPPSIALLFRDQDVILSLDLGTFSCIACNGMHTMWNSDGMLRRRKSEDTESEDLAGCSEKDESDQLEGMTGIAVGAAQYWTV